MMRLRHATATVMLVTSAVTLTACSSSASDSTSVSAAASTDAAPGASLIGSDPGTYSPVPITPSDDNAIIRLKIGQHVLFQGFGPDATYASTDAKVFTVEPGGTSGGVTTNPGGTAVGEGDAFATVDDAGKTYTIQISVMSP
jgi:hypothetical protein